MGLSLCRRHSVTHDRMGTRHRATSAKEVVGSWATTEADAPRRQAQTGLGQGACIGPATACLAHDRMAGSHGGEVVLAICLCARSCRAPGLLARRQPAGGVAADRMARWREGADQKLAVEVGGKRGVPDFRSYCPGA